MLQHKIIYLVQINTGARCWHTALFFQGNNIGYAAVNLDSGGIHDRYYKTPTDFEIEVCREDCHWIKVSEYTVKSD
jgi:hypothetical protein